MKPINILIAAILAPVVLVPIFIALVYLYAWGPIFFLRLTPYQEIQRRITFPQWINNDEICYLELVLHRDKTVFEQGKFILFIKNPIMDIYIYREKVGYPETKKLIKHIARKNIDPCQSLEGSLDSDLGFRVYDNGKKIFLYYKSVGGVIGDYRYVTLDINGRNMRERIPKIIPFDISQDGKKLYGVRYDDLDEDNENYILEYSIRDGKIKRLIEITEDKVEQSRRADIKDLKLLSKDKLVLSYHTDSIVPDSGVYIYLVDISEKSFQLVDKLLLSSPHSDAISNYYAGEYAIDFTNGFTISKDGKFLIAGNIGIYERKDNNWIEISDFYKEYPSISPDGKRMTFIDVLMKKDKRNWPSFAGRKLAIVGFEDLIRDEGTTKVK
jgi:hypothetical protein